MLKQHVVTLLIWILTAFIFVCGCYLIYAAIEAYQTGIVYPRTPRYPVLRSENVYGFYLLVLMILVAGLAVLFSSLVMFRGLIKGEIKISQPSDKKNSK